MKDLKITKGEWFVNKGGINISEEDGLTYGTINGSETEYSICSVWADYSENNAEADSNLIADAGTTANKCGLLPSELLEQRDMLLEALELLLETAKNYESGIYTKSIYDAYSVSEKAIEKTKQ